MMDGDFGDAEALSAFRIIPWRLDDNNECDLNQAKTSSSGECAVTDGQTKGDEEVEEICPSHIRRRLRIDVRRLIGGINTVSQVIRVQFDSNPSPDRQEVLK
jgi:hypothetical protein